MVYSKLQRVIVASAVLVLLALPAASATVTDKFEQRWNIDPGGKLLLSNENGSVDVRSWDRNQVQVRADIRMKAGSRSAAEEALEEVKIEATQDGDTIAVKTRKPRGSDGFFAWLAGRNLDVTVHYEILVPARFDVDIETVNGRIEARSLSGTVELDTVNGRIEVHDSRGTVSADTVNGSIDVEILEVSDAQRMTFSTTNGGIELALPGTIGADLDAATTNGKISTDIPLTTDSFSRSRIRGTLNGGGAPIKLRTVNGSIRIHSSS